MLPIFALAGSSAALQQPPSMMARRGVLAAGAAALAAPLAALANDPIGATGREGGALAATCLGFGCNGYGGLDFNGLPAEQAPPGSLPYPDFLAAIKAKKVEGVVFEPPAGNVAYAIIEGKSVRIGEGWPVEVSNSWSSPAWVVRILENEGVPYAWNFDLKAKNKVKTGGAGYAKDPYVPTYKTGLSVAGPVTYQPQPKMYGGADAAIAGSDTADYSGNLK
jgi:hypothetical protein